MNILHVHFAQIFWCQKITKPNMSREKLLNLLLYEKHAHKMLMKLTPGLELPCTQIFFNLINLMFRIVNENIF